MMKLGKVLFIDQNL